MEERKTSLAYQLHSAHFIERWISKFSSSFSTIKCKKFSCSINIWMWREGKGGSSFVWGSQSRWKINEKNIFHYSPHLSKRNDAKLGALRQAKLTTGNMKHSKKYHSNFMAIWKTAFLGRKRARGEIWGFLCSALGKHRATCNSECLVQMWRYKQLYNNEYHTIQGQIGRKDSFRASPAPAKTFSPLMLPFR